jgi:hypothetical protein
MAWEVGVSGSGVLMNFSTRSGWASDLTLNGSLAGTGVASVAVEILNNSSVIRTHTWTGGFARLGGDYAVNGGTLSARAVVNGVNYIFAKGRSGTEWQNEITVSSTSPLVLDLNGDGVQTLGLEAAVSFDLKADGSDQRSGWVDRHDGLLTLDLNGNGRVDHGAELFGNRTMMRGGRMARDGWEALTQHDNDGDGVVSAADALFAHLKVWVDANGDGVSDAAELHSLSSLGITALDLSHDDQSFEQHGNQLVGQGRAHKDDGSTVAMTDVWFISSSPSPAVDASMPLAGSQPEEQPIVLPSLAELLDESGPLPLIPAGAGLQAHDAAGPPLTPAVPDDTPLLRAPEIAPMNPFFWTSAVEHRIFGV